MTLLDVIKLAENDYDTYDVDYDCGVTVSYIDVERSSYDKFCNLLMGKVEVVRIVTGHHLTVNWSGFIKNNIDKFREFTKQYWKSNCQYENDEDEFISQWINEFHNYIVGNVPDDFYETLVKFIESL